MNINDFENSTEIPANIWEAIFMKQMAVAQKYKDIENMGTLLEEKNNIDTAVGQRWIKDFSWRVTEEIAEALEARRAVSEIDVMDVELLKSYEQHYTEELIDALHFITELTIIAGYDYKIVPAAEEIDDEWDVVYWLGVMCNCLKNKPWKQTQMLTDRPKFEKYLKKAWAKMYGILKYSCNMSNEDIFNLYFKKNEVNKFRIRSNY